MLVGSLAHTGTIASASVESDQRTDDRNRDTLLKHLRPALESAGGAGRLYYIEICGAGGVARFPRIRVQPPSKGKKGLAAVQEVFKDGNEVTVTQGRSGMIRINVGKVPSEILQTKIRLLTLKPEAQYTEQLAIIAMTSTKEVEAAMRKFGLEHPVVVVSIHVLEPIPGVPQPHLPRSFRNVTLDQALDSVAKTFGGIVIYGECARPTGTRFFDVDFACVKCGALDAGVRESPPLSIVGFGQIR
jgi:hypothetical protein